MTVKRFTEQEKLEENCEPKTMDVEEYCLCSLRWGVFCMRRKCLEKCRKSVIQRMKATPP